MIWKSVVGKLWATILLFFTFVLFILTILLTQFINNYIIGEVTQTLTNTASKIAVVLEQHDDFEFGLEVAIEMVDDVTKVIIISDENHVYYSNEADSNVFSLDYFQKEEEFSRVITDQETVTKEITIPDHSDGDGQEEAIMIGVPLDVFENSTGAVYIYQSLDVMRESTQSITELILWSAFIAFILTTVFAFFLSTRITAPLRTMIKAAQEVANGQFDTKVPMLTNDEIGELGSVFNQMRKRLKINMTALNQEKEQLASILSSMVDGVIMFNRKGKIMVLNPPAEKFLQYWNYEQEAEETDTVPSAILELFKNVVVTGEEQFSDLSLQGRYWNVIVSPLYDKTDVRGAVAVFRDMTEERRLDKLRKDFVANVSHELRTPIAMMQGYSEALMDDVVSTDEERTELATIINEESLRMGRLVNELLDMARMESGATVLNQESVPLLPFMNRVVKKFSTIAKEREVWLNAKLDINDEYFYFDADRIEQVLTNLIDNALRHTESGGVIEVIGKTDEHGLKIDVSDSGSGIPSEDLPFVFERFYKADKARTRGRSGTGLGLAIAKNIVVAHQGSIDVKSKLGQGTTFTVFIPRKN